MKDIRDRLGADTETTRLLRAQYAAPEGEAYWITLEASVMSRIAGDRTPARGPFELLAGWSRLGLIAAGVASILAGVAAARERQSDRNVTAQAVLIDSSPVLAIQTAQGSGAAREATLRYLITNP